MTVNSSIFICYLCIDSNRYYVLVLIFLVVINIVPVLNDIIKTALKDNVEELIEFHDSPLFPFPKPTHYLGSDGISNILLPNVTLDKVFNGLNEPEIEKNFGLGLYPVDGNWKVIYKYLGNDLLDDVHEEQE